jgi:hypothetical protein
MYRPSASALWNIEEPHKNIRQHKPLPSQQSLLLVESVVFALWIFFYFCLYFLKSGKNQSLLQFHFRGSIFLFVNSPRFFFMLLLFPLFSICSSLPVLTAPCPLEC